MAQRYIPINFMFTNQVGIFAFRSLGQFGGTSPPVSLAEYLVEGSEMTETFVTNGSLSAGGVSYLLNTMSRRTV